MYRRAGSLSSLGLGVTREHSAQAAVGVCPSVMGEEVIAEIVPSQHLDVWSDHHYILSGQYPG